MDMEVYRKIKISIQTILGIDLEHYKDEQMRRRLDSWLSRVGAPSWDDYFGKIQKDRDEYQRFRNFITINVTEFYRDNERWKYLNQNVMPSLLQGNNRLRIWSAGCSKGAEIYSVAMMLEDLSPGVNHALIATDLDHGALAIARKGGPYVAEEVRNISPIQMSKFFQKGNPPYFLNGTLQPKIQFKEQDLVKDNFETGFDLIICRNVVIYFTMETKQVLYKKFHSSLKNGGVLFVGGTEIIPRPQDIGFKSSGFSFYSKI
jgi:chemotaxis protein methyltransferase CheR